MCVGQQTKVWSRATDSSTPSRYVFMTDIDMAPVVVEMLDTVQPGMVATFAEKTGLTFTAGK